MRKTLLLASTIVIAAITTASAADLRQPVYTKAPPPAPVLFNWTGFYVGLNAGGKWITNSDETVTAGGTTFTLDGGNNDSSWIAGGQIGYNWQAPGSQWVFGVEGDVDAQDFNRTRVVGAPIGPFVVGDAFTFESHWQASVRGRIGYAFDRVLLYATGGVAFTQLKGSAALVGLGVVTDDQTIVGGTVGGGIEWAVWNNISLGVEGRWTFYGDNDFNGGTLVGNVLRDRVNLDTAEVMGKINFRF